MNLRRVILRGGLLMTATVSAYALSGCQSAQTEKIQTEGQKGESGEPEHSDNQNQDQNDQKGEKGDSPFYAGMAMSETPDLSELLTGSMNLADYQDKWVYYEEYGCYGLEYVVYCENPADPVKECMNIYVPEAYMNSDGTINLEGTVNGYTAETAPIIYKNGIGGYAQADASKMSEKNRSYIDQGYIFVSPASRGKETQAEDGTYIGKSPAGLVDLKAGIRFLKANDEVMAGDADRIISIGTSAGGAMSALLGSTGNVSDYDVYLKEIGAIMDQTDDVYAAQAYCPITDLDHADQAYEWMYENLQTYKNSRSNQEGESSDFEKAVSGLMASEYVDYINALGLKDPETGETLTLGEDGRSGSFYEYMKKQVEDAATKYLTKLSDGSLSATYSLDDYLKGNYTKTGRGKRPGEAGKEEAGTDLSSFLTWDGTTAKISSLDDYLSAYNPRMKTVMAFDNLEMTENSGENLEFGDADHKYMHFDSYMSGVLEKLKESFPSEYAEYADAYSAVNGDQELAERKKLLNPLNYIGNQDAKADTAKYIRIRVGTQDADTSLSISAEVALTLQNQTDADVDYALVWDQPHGDADYDGELIEWIDQICQK
ncbi:subtype B tannase [Brotaphodocola sp.]|uniref:subtype B tannase n=1 Tax=Brotaphodocola sp. TaxID=3073577 RepID=UPI003D7E0B76